MRRKLLALAAAVAVAPAAQAGSLELSLSDDVAELGYYGNTNAMDLGQGQFFGTVLFTEADDVIGTVGLRSINRVSPSLRAFVGLKGYFGKLDAPDESMGAVAVGGGVGVGLASQIPLEIIGSVNWAPDILSFSEAEGVTELEVRLQSQLTPNAAAFIGYRWLEVELESYARDYEAVDEALIGVSVGF